MKHCSRILRRSRLPSFRCQSLSMCACLQYFPVCRILHALLQKFGRQHFHFEAVSVFVGPLSHPQVPFNCCPHFISFSIFHSFVLFYLLPHLFPTSSNTRHSFLSCFLRSSLSRSSHLTFSFIAVFPSLFIAHSFHFLPSVLLALHFVSFHRLPFLLSPVFLHLITPHPSPSPSQLQ